MLKNFLEFPILKTQSDSSLIELDHYDVNKIMESKKKPRMSRLSPGAKFLAKERRKSTLREYGKSRHVVRLSEDTWAKWNLLKNEKNLATHDEFAVRLLQLW